MMKLNIETEKWKRRAMAFAVRAHNHLWGKNNEDPMVFLYRHNLNHDFSRQMYLGWNKFGQERPYENWGIHQDGKFLIPPGIVFPHIIDKDLKALFIIPIDEGEKDMQERLYTFPGTPDHPVVLGNSNNEIRETGDILKGLSLFQENQEDLCIKIIL